MAPHPRWRDRADRDAGPSVRGTSGAVVPVRARGGRSGTGRDAHRRTAACPAMGTGRGGSAGDAGLGGCGELLMLTLMGPAAGMRRRVLQPARAAAERRRPPTKAAAGGRPRSLYALAEGGEPGRSRHRRTGGRSRGAWTSRTRRCRPDTGQLKIRSSPGARRGEDLPASHASAAADPALPRSRSGPDPAQGTGNEERRGTLSSQFEHDSPHSTPSRSENSVDTRT